VTFVKPLRISSFLIYVTSITPSFKASNDISWAWRETHNKLRSVKVEILLMVAEVWIEPLN
jgi:hypothetical protein